MTTNSTSDERRADEAELLGNDGEDEIGLRLRQEADLLLPLHEAAHRETARADRDEGLDDLESAAERIEPRIPPRHHALGQLGAAGATA